MTESIRFNPALFRLFKRYSVWFTGRNFHRVRLLRGAEPELPADDTPVIVYMNHPSWWDPLICLTLVDACFAGRTHHAPIDAAALNKYRFFRRIGFFGVEQGTRRGAATFLRESMRVLGEDHAVLWVTAQGGFTDPRQRPVQLAPGVAHLARRLERGVLLPLAVELPFWEERYPEALAAFGGPITIGDHAGRSAEAWNALLTDRLTGVMDRLTDAAIARDAARFATVRAGRVGVGGAYDLWRRAAAALRGRRFDPSHGGQGT